MLHPILLTSAKVPNDLEIYPTFNVDLTTTNEQHINSDLSVNFPATFIIKGTSEYRDVKVFLYPYAHHFSGGGSIRAEYTEDNITYVSVLGVNKEQVEYVVWKRDGTVAKDEVLAT